MGGVVSAMLWLRFDESVRVTPKTLPTSSLSVSDHRQDRNVNVRRFLHDLLGVTGHFLIVLSAIHKKHVLQDWLHLDLR